MSTPRHASALEELRLLRLFEDQELIALVEDTVARLHDLGDRLEAFAEGRSEQEGATDGGRHE